MYGLIAKRCKNKQDSFAENSDEKTKLGVCYMAERKIEERKHLFGTTEKSDFILNMTPQGTHKLCGLYSIIAIAVLLAVNIPYYIASHEFNYAEDGIRHYSDDLFADYIGILVIGVGLIGFWFFLVGRMKKEVVLKDNRALLIPVFIIAVSAWSMFASGAISTAFLGYLDRNEGLLTILAYWGFFAGGMALTDDGWRKRFTDFVIAVGLFNAVVGILQAIPAMYNIIPNKFKDLFVRFGSTATDGEFTTNEGVFEKGYAATGFLVTPFAMAAVMTIIFGLAAAGLAFEKSGKKKLFYGVSAVACTAAAVLTKTIVGIIGIGAASVTLLVVSAVKAGAKKQKAPLIISLCTVIVLSAGVAGVIVSDAVESKDEQIIYTDTFYRMSMGLPRQNKEKWIYPYLWNDGGYILEHNLLTGVGPDNWYELYAGGCSTDRSYNEYLDVGMQRGIICMALYIGFLLVTLAKLIRALKQHFQNDEQTSWVAVGLMCAVVGYLVQAFFNSGSNYSSPYFWLTIGICWSYFAAKKAKAKSKE